MSADRGAALFSISLNAATLNSASDDKVLTIDRRCNPAITSSNNLIRNKTLSYNFPHLYLLAC